MTLGTPNRVRYQRAKELRIVRRNAAAALVELDRYAPGTLAYYEACVSCAIALRAYLIASASPQQVVELYEAFPQLHQQLPYSANRSSSG